VVGATVPEALRGADGDHRTIAGAGASRLGRSDVAPSAVVTLLRLALAATFVLTLFVTQSSTASAATACKSSGYACTLDGYNATTMNDSWAAKYYGSDTKDGIGTPPHNCTLFAAWMLAHNGLPDPGHPWGYADQWGLTLASETNQTPAVGAIAWYDGPGMGHVAYVARRLVKSHGIPRVGQLRRRQ